MTHRPLPALASVVLLSLACGGEGASTATPDPATVIANLEASVSPRLVVEGRPSAEASLAERMAHHGVPGVSVTVFLDGEVAWARGWGVADLETGRPVDAGTLFQAASISKPVAAVGALRLVEGGVLDLDADVNEALTSWQMPENRFTTAEKVTLRRILSHTAGTTVWGFPGYGAEEAVPSPVGVLDGEGNTDPVRVYREPGEGWQYSGGGYTVAQVLMVDVSGMPFPELMDSLVLRPTGMTHSTYRQPLPAERRAEAATGYRRDGTPVSGNFHTYPEMAAAGLWTTPTDLARFAMAVQEAADGQGGALVSRETAAEMLTPVDNDYALGFGITGEGTRFGHGGANEGFRCQLVAFVDGRGGVAVMTNSDGGGALANEIILSVAREYGWPGPAPDVKVLAELTAEQLDAVAGTYRIEGVGDIRLEVADGGLLVHVPGEDVPRALWPEGPGRFFRPDDGTPVAFELEGGRAVGLVIGGTTRGERIEP